MAARVVDAIQGRLMVVLQVAEEVTHVDGSRRVAWRPQGSSLVLDLRVPVNAVAEVLLPGGSATSSGQAPTGWTGSGGVGYRSCGATSPAIVGRRPG